MARFTGTENNDTLFGTDGNDEIFGLGGDDFLNGLAGDDLMVGGAGNDQYGVDSAGDQVVEDADGGADAVYSFLNAYTLGANIESLLFTGGVNASFTGTGNSLNNFIQGRDGDDFLFGAGGSDNLFGQGGSDQLDGGEGDDFLVGGTGADRMAGGAGNDSYEVDDIGDVVIEDAGAGRDVVSTTLASYALSATVEDLTGLSNGGQSLTGNALGNAVTGGAGNDFLLLQQGGDDAAIGGAGDDAVYFGAAMTRGDRVDGGGGANDQVGLQGAYAGLVLGAGSLAGVETLVLLPGSDARFGDASGSFYDYAITAENGLVGPGRQLRVNMNALRAGEDVAFNGSAESAGTFLTFAGFGADALTGGQGSDAFFFGTGRFGAGDRVDGQGGADDQLGLQGDYAGANALTFGAGQLVGVETVVVLTASDARFGGSGAAGFSYALTTSDGNAQGGARLTINANSLRAGEVLTFNGSAEDDSPYRIFSGAGDDAIVGGGVADVIFGGAGADRITGGGGADQVTGGAGDDLFAYLSTGESAAGATDVLNGFGPGDRIDLSAIDADAGNGAGDDAFRFIGERAFSGSAGELRLTGDGANGWTAEGDTDGNGLRDLVISVNMADNSPLSEVHFIL